MMGLLTKNKIIIAITLLITSVIASLPNCHASEFFQLLPLVPEEAYILDLSTLFQGYNLQFNVTADPDILPYVQVGQKIKVNQQQFPDDPMMGLKSYFLDKSGNSWKQHFVALTERGDRTQIFSGILNDDTLVPVINFKVNVQNFTNTTCFDAVQVGISNVIIVDCVQRRASKDARGRQYQNVFYYFRINDGSKIKEVVTEMYVPFQQFTRRKLLLYTDALSQHPLLIRAYCADSMTDPTRDNTYVEVLMIEDPLNPWVVGLIDRTFLGVPRLRIIDTKIYLGEIYILDEIKGVHRIQISGYEDLHYRGCYEARGFNRLALFSPNLDNHIELAISNTHSIHQVDWTDIQFPRLLNKYSLLPYSSVSQLFLNERFIFVRSLSADAQSSYDYTWTFTRGDRTYSRAFAVMKHQTNNTMIDLNQKLTYLLVLNQQKLTNYAYDDPSFILKLKEKEQFMDKVRTFTLNATSWDPSTSAGNLSCTITINFTLLDPNNRTMWVVGRGPPQKFTANYPGKVRLELGQYILGPNVTYRLRQTKKGQLPKAKIYQQQQLLVNWQNSPPFESATFLQTQTFTGVISDTLMIYIQNDQNVTFISKCFPSHESLSVNCQLVETKDLGGHITNWGTSVILQPYSQEQHHLLGYTTGSFYNMVFLYDLSTGKEIDEFQVGRGFPGNITSLAVSGKYMYTVERHIKRVDIYSLEKCLEQKCTPICSLNHLNMFQLGLKYFAPRAVHSSKFHPQLLFVKTDDSILAVDLSKECVPKILSKFTPVESTRTPFSFEINANYLVVTIQPDTVQEYDISRIYLKEVRMTKKYPLYGHKLPSNYNLDISDYGNCVFLSTLSEGGNYNVFVYRSGLPAVGSLYNQIDLYAFQHVLMDASGYGIDYVSIISGKEMRIYRQYETPEGRIDNPNEDYTFYLQYFNSLDSANLSLIAVQILNLPTYIIVNPFLKDIMNTRNLLYSGYNKLNEIDDSDWYTGNVLYIQPTCGDCPDKVKVNNHIQLESKQKIIPLLTSYVYSPEGGELLAERTLLKMQSNGTISQVVELHQNKKRKCLEVAVATHFTVIGCRQDDQVFLQAVSSVGTKSFAFEQQETSAANMLRLQVSNQLVMLVDVEADSYVKTRKGGIFLFQISDDLQTQQPLVQIQYVDGDDFGMRQLGDIYINNAELTYLGSNGLYRLYLSEMNRGLLVMEFQHLSGKADIIVRRTYFVELKSYIVGLGQTLPYDATFQAVTLMESTKNSQAKTTTDVLLITTGRYHTIQLAITFDANSNLITKTIQRFYLRYSFYDVENQIKHINGLFLIRHSLSEEYNQDSRSKQLYTVYSTQGKFNGSIEKRGLIGALPLEESLVHRFDFNSTVDPDSGASEPRVGLVAVQQGGEVARGSLHRKLSLFTTELLDTQIIYLDLINDFNTERIRILLNGLAPFPQWKLITIILFSIIGFFLLVGMTVFLIRKIKQAKEGMPEQRQTLLTEGTET